MKQRMVKMPKSIIRRPRSGGQSAFGGGGGAHAFRDPMSMAAPDQAFSAAMAPPQGASAAPSAGPGPSSPTG